MSYLHLIIAIAIINGMRVVRRLIRPSTPCTVDADMIGWLNLLATCDDHAVITSYARSTFT